MSTTPNARRTSSERLLPARRQRGPRLLALVASVLALAALAVGAAASSASAAMFVSRTGSPGTATHTSYVLSYNDDVFKSSPLTISSPTSRRLTYATVGYSLERLQPGKDGRPTWTMVRKSAVQGYDVPGSVTTRGWQTIMPDDNGTYYYSEYRLVTTVTFYYYGYAKTDITNPKALMGTTVLTQLGTPGSNESVCEDARPGVCQPTFRGILLTAPQ